MPDKHVINWKILLLWLIAAMLVSPGLQMSAGSNVPVAIGIVVGAFLLSIAITEIEERITNKPSVKKGKRRR